VCLLGIQMQGLGKFRGGVADVTAVKVYLVNSIFPTLVPGLVELMKALEKNKQVATADQREVFDTQSVPLRVYIGQTIAPILNDSLEECYNSKPRDPVDHLAGLLFQQADSISPSTKKGESVNPILWLAQFLMRNNPNFNAPNKKHRATIQPPSPSNTRIVRQPPPVNNSRRLRPAGQSAAAKLKETSAVLVQQEHITNGQHFVVTVTQDEEKLVFHVYNPHRSVQYTTEIRKSDLSVLVPESEDDKISVAGVAEILVSRMKLVRESLRTRLTFANRFAEGEGCLPYYQGLHKFLENTYVIEVTEEDPQQNLLKFKAHDQQSDQSCEVVHQIRLPPARQDYLPKIRDFCNKQLQVTDGSDSGMRLEVVGVSSIQRKLSDAQNLDEKVSSLIVPTDSLDVRSMQSRTALWSTQKDKMFNHKAKQRHRQHPMQVVFKKGMKLQGRHVIVTLKISAAGVSETMLWTVYDQSSCEVFSLAAKYSDTRHLKPLAPGQLLRGDSFEMISDIACRLQLRKIKGKWELQLDEDTPLATKWHHVFDKFNSDTNGRVSRQDLLEVLRGAGTEVTSFIRELSSASSVDHSVRYLHAVISKVLIDDRDSFAWSDFSDIMATPTPSTFAPQNLTETSLVLRDNKADNVTGTDIDVFVYAESGRARAPTLVEAWDLQNFQEYSLQVSIPQISLLIKESTGSLKDIATKLVARVQLVREIVAKPVIGQPIRAKVVYRGAKYVDGKYAIVSVYEDSRIRLYVPRLSRWFEASYLGAGLPPLPKCWERIRFVASPTGLVLALD